MSSQSVTGIVITTEKGYEMQLANVILKTKTAEGRVIAQTDALGEFAINVDVDTIVYFQHHGYVSKSIKIEEGLDHLIVELKKEHD